MVYTVYTHTHTHTHTHTCTHALMHAHLHTHTPTHPHTHTPTHPHTHTPPHLHTHTPPTHTHKRCLSSLSCSVPGVTAGGGQQEVRDATAADKDRHGDIRLHVTRQMSHVDVDARQASERREAGDERARDRGHAKRAATQEPVH